MISREHFIETYWNLRYRPGLIDTVHIKRFKKLRNRYSDICDLFFLNRPKLLRADNGYNWSEWTGQIRRSFNKGIPVGFLAHSTLVKTMVFSRRGGVKTTGDLIEQVISAFGERKARILLREDFIGQPTIQNVPFMTSANRAWHANHLSRYTGKCNKEIWDAPVLVEWGGGYGNMARIVRKMNPSITYIIIDLPEVLALQYVYLASLEGEESINLLTPENSCQILPGKVNLISSHLVLSEDMPIKCEAFISTWAITESPRVAQEYVVKKDYFGAKNILLGFNLDEHNFIVNSSFDKPFQKAQAPFIERLGRKNNYWFL